MKFSFSRPAPKAYWWQGVPNFGDCLAPLLLDRFADLKVEWSPVGHSQIVSVGSVLEHVPPLYDGVILGSGRLIENSRIYLQSKGSVTPTILALRGPLTARGIPGSYAIGDPGILADELVGPQEKQYDLGILPHFSDEKLYLRYKHLMPKGSNLHLISPTWDPLTVLREIGACKRLVTSSLHGVIVADAFGISRKVEYTPTMDKDGGNFKLRDYHASIRMPFEIGKMGEASRLRVEDLKYEIYDAYRALGGMAKSW
jgi:pyruvyltransferase